MKLEELRRLAIQVDVDGEPITEAERVICQREMREDPLGVYGMLARICCYGSLAIKRRLEGNIREALAWEKGKDDEYNKLKNSRTNLTDSIIW